MQSMGGSSSGGAKLTHSHSTQFTFASQTFTLWQLVSKNMYSKFHQPPTSRLVAVHDCTDTNLS